MDFCRDMEVQNAGGGAEVGAENRGGSSPEVDEASIDEAPGRTHFEYTEGTSRYDRRSPVCGISQLY